jgi:hypothetical protein
MGREGCGISEPPIGAMWLQTLAEERKRMAIAPGIATMPSRGCAHLQLPNARHEVALDDVTGRGAEPQ